MIWFLYCMYAVIGIALLCSVYFSFASRRSREPRERGLLTAKLNIAMGAMLLGVAFIQLFMFIDSYIRMGFGVICLLIGAFNLFAGFRNHSYFRTMKS